MAFRTSGRGRNQREVLADARRKAALWFEQPETCVRLTLHDVSERLIEGTISTPDVIEYEADVSASVGHSWERRATGFPSCRDCGIRDYS